jgi:HD-like signal output (HDOD) protein
MLASYVFAFEVIGTFQAKNFRTDFDITTFWKNSFACALFSLTIAGKFKDVEAEGVFLSGLLNNVGILVIRQYFPDIFMKIRACAKSEKVSFRSACTMVCCLDHKYIAYLLALKWNLPSNILTMFHVTSEEIALNNTLALCRNIVNFSESLLYEKNFYIWDPYQNELVEKADFSQLPEFTNDSIGEIISRVEDLITFQN